MCEESSHSNFGQGGAELVEGLSSTDGVCDKAPYEKPATIQIGTVVSMTQGRKGRGFIDNGSSVSK